ncbi:uncharacterized protein METZ01_LOCUS393844 [marine metagenome]|uniref:Uncharacterized protein n=1 Tax=marine metagenome TaxID=408172 RepID=A0A382V3G5_9ZZZZ
MTARANTGSNLIREWRINALQGRFHIDGHFYERLERFPAVLCDQHGYVLFETREEYENSPYLKIGQKVNVASHIGDISCMPGYIQKN